MATRKASVALFHRLFIFPDKEADKAMKCLIMRAIKYIDMALTMFLLILFRTMMRQIYRRYRFELMTCRFLRRHQ